MFSFLPLINNSVTIRLCFLLVSISAIISSKTINFFVFYWNYIFNVFINLIHIILVFNKSFRIVKMLYSNILIFFLIKNWYFASYGSLAYKWILSISGSWFIRLKMNLFFQIQSLKLLIFSLNDQECLASLGYILLCCFLQNHQS